MGKRSVARPDRDPFVEARSWLGRASRAVPRGMRATARRARGEPARGDARGTSGHGRISARTAEETRALTLGRYAPKAGGGGDLPGAEERGQRHGTADGRPDGVHLRAKGRTRYGQSGRARTRAPGWRESDSRRAGNNLGFVACGRSRPRTTRVAKGIERARNAPRGESRSLSRL